MVLNYGLSWIIITLQVDDTEERVCDLAPLVLPHRRRGGEAETSFQVFVLLLPPV